jgi:hypothetical protein
MKTWHRVSHNMHYIKGGGTKEHVEFDTAVPQCQFKGRDFGECDGDIVKMKVCGFRVARILKDSTTQIGQDFLGLEKTRIHVSSVNVFDK